MTGDQKNESNKHGNEVAEEVRVAMGADWLPSIYSTEILTLRTRSYELDVPATLSDPEIHHTLLGVELKVGQQRKLCPDLATARYLAVFARLHCKEVAVPYDITLISGFADKLESSWQRVLILIEHLAPGRSSLFYSRLRRRLAEQMRHEIEMAGPGTKVPQFKQSTRQRPS